MSRLIEAYPVELDLTIVTPPASDVDPAPLLRAKYGVRDAQELAAYWNVQFAGKKEPDSGMVRDIGTVLIRPVLSLADEPQGTRGVAGDRIR